MQAEAALSDALTQPSNLFEMAGPPPLPTYDPTRWSNIDYATRCWGAAIANHDGSRCTPGFTSGKAHFKNKFCAACRETLDVPAWRVRALTEEMRALYMSNSLSAGVWKRAPVELGGGEFRLVNNTITCDGPWLVIYREEPPDLEWEPLPTGWIENGLVRMSVAKGTLVPICELSHPSARRAAAQPSVLDAAATSSTGSPEGGKRQKRRAGVMTQGAEPQPPEADLTLQPLVGGAHHNTPCCMSMAPVSPSMPQVQGMTVGGGSPQVQVGAAPAVALLRPCAAAVQPHVQQIPPTMTTASPFQQQLAHQPDHAVRQGMAAYPPQAVVPPQPVAPASGDPAVWWAYRGGQPSMPAMAPLPGVPLTSVPSSGSSSAGVGRGSGIGGSADNDPLAMSHESINTLRGGDLVHASSSTVIVTPPDSSISHGTSPLGSTSPVESSCSSSDLSSQQQQHAAAVAYDASRSRQGRDRRDSRSERQPDGRVSRRCGTHRRFVHARRNARRRSG